MSSSARAEGLLFPVLISGSTSDVPTPSSPLGALQQGPLLPSGFFRADGGLRRKAAAAALEFRPCPVRSCLRG